MLTPMAMNATPTPLGKDVRVGNIPSHRLAKVTTISSWLRLINMYTCVPKSQKV